MDDQLFKLLTLLFIAIVALAQSSKIAIKSLAKRAEKKNGNPGKTTINGKMCIKHDRAITVNTTNITNIEKKIDKSIEENGKSFTRIFDKLDDLKG